MSWSSDFTNIQQTPRWQPELYKNDSGEFQGRVNAANGETIASGQGYKSKASAENGFESVRKNAPTSALAKRFGVGDRGRRGKKGRR
ncbi:YegP family protein [Nocardia sp. NPDC060249]|uniref:YegP family protein n=1 Tax=Nocardia sp. NPDC060249 TaxID=3347082 RepID=UPI0036560F17